MTPVVMVASVALLVTVGPARSRGRTGDLSRPAAFPPDRALLSTVAALFRRVVPFASVIGDGGLITFVGFTAVLLVVSPVLALLPTALLVGVSSRRRRSATAAAAASIDRSLPEMIDLVTLGVGSGLTARHALALSVPWLGDPFSSAISEVIRRSNSGEPFSVALEVVMADLGPSVRPLVNTLIAAETDGAALLPALLRVGDEARRRRRVEAENRARRVPVAMLFPLVLCIFPAFALLTVVPLLLGSLADLSLPG